jgi:excinuclease ABC subunit C
MDPHPVLPFRVETYDISNIQGTLATASMVVFVDGMPEKKEYRKFKIKLNQDLDPTIHKSNDFAMLEETLNRRLARTDWTAPDLLVIDGGKGQLSSAIKALKNANMKIPIISIAKQEEELFLPGRSESVRLPYDSPALYLIQRMRDEAHRFTITYHRSLRSKEHIKSALDEVPSIGPKTKKLLITTFESVAGIKAAPDEALEKVIGKRKTKLIREYL